ncbi:hypothetical protein AB0I28_34355 [Phytomonospora sp. NPDC050363]|uniref:hypothetical protein n=1 Tax=Phytomonospora sp. NPDC050363 TaxID=3155642 RepID=UPI0033F2F40F
MKLLSRVGDALVARLAPKATAEAAPCEVRRSKCVGATLYYCYYDNCNGGRLLGCYSQGPQCA